VYYYDDGLEIMHTNPRDNAQHVLWKALHTFLPLKSSETADGGVIGRGE